MMGRRKVGKLQLLGLKSSVKLEGVGRRLLSGMENIQLHSFRKLLDNLEDDVQVTAV